jgi:uncharacterized Zn finger protein (UPF0148 family)
MKTLEFCLRCGAGVDKFRREGEGTCPDCDPEGCRKHAATRKKTVTIYDPPGGWRYGFPREYKPLLGESIEQTLLRDKYPQKEIDVWKEDGVPCRFWET